MVIMVTKKRDEAVGKRLEFIFEMVEFSFQFSNIRNEKLCVE